MTASASISRAACCTGRRFPKILMARISGRTTCGPRGIATGSSCWGRNLVRPSGRHSGLPRFARGMSSLVVIMAISIATSFPSSIDLIRHSKADVLLVAMGNPKQELFIEKHLATTGCTLGIGVGALFDFLAGNVPRAMPWVQTLAARMVLSSGARAAPPRGTLPGRHSGVLDACGDAALVGRASEELGAGHARQRPRNSLYTQRRYSSSCRARAAVSLNRRHPVIAVGGPA